MRYLILFLSPLVILMFIFIGCESFETLESEAQGWLEESKKQRELIAKEREQNEKKLKETESRLASGDISEDEKERLKTEKERLRVEQQRLQAEEQRRQEEQRRYEEEQRRAEEQRRQEEQRRAEEQNRLTLQRQEEQRRYEEEQRRVEEQRRQAGIEQHKRCYDNGLIPCVDTCGNRYPLKNGLRSHYASKKVFKCENECHKEYKVCMIGHPLFHQHFP